MLASLDDVWCAYNSSDEGGLILTGLTGVVRVKKRPILGRLRRALGSAKAALGQGVELPSETAVPKCASK